MQLEYEHELKRREDMAIQKTQKLQKYICKEQEYREKIEEYSKIIR